MSKQHQEIILISETFKKNMQKYKRQLEMYQWLFKNGFKVSQEAYLLYFNGRKMKSF